MADIFGISQAIQGVIEVYFRSARRTGRTMCLLQYVRPGDTVVFDTQQRAMHFEAQCRDGLIDSVRAIVIPPSAPESVFDRPMTKGRLIFDHMWLEEHYRLAVQQIDQRLGHIAMQASGHGEPHRKTAKEAEEIARWRI
jgi:hypothetical protein